MSVQSVNAASRILTSLPTHDIAGIALRAICRCGHHARAGRPRASAALLVSSAGRAAEARPERR
eukprot:6853196-Prymnesium_polylepis.1